jgi:hypothetical protein
MTRALTVAALTVALLAPTPVDARLHRDDGAPPERVPERPTVRVSRGQSLSSIAADHDVPGGWRRLAYVNKRKVMPNPDLIEVGVQLTIPQRDGRKIQWSPTTSSSGTRSSSAPSSASQAPSSSSSPSSPPASSGDIWWQLALCESGGRQHAHSPSGTYHSFFQWSLATWRSLGMAGDPHDYPYGVQLEAAKRLQARSGWGQWPACSAKLGLR